MIRYCTNTSNRSWSNHSRRSSSWFANSISSDVRGYSCSRSWSGFFWSSSCWSGCYGSYKFFAY